MNPYFLEYLSDPEYGYSPLADPVFLAATVATNLVVFGVPGFLVGLLAARLSQRPAILVIGAAAAISILEHLFRIGSPSMLAAYIADLACALGAFVLAVHAGRQCSRFGRGGPTMR